MGLKTAPTSTNPPKGKPLAKTYKAPAHQPALPNFQTLGMLGQMPMTVHPAAREKWTGYREDPNQSEIADHTTTVKFEPSSDSPVEKNGRFVSLWKEGSHLIDAQGRSVELATEDDEEDVSLPMSRIDLQDKTDITIPDAESTPKGKFDGMAIQDTYFDSDDSEYPDEEFQTATEGTSKPEAGCQLHCNNEILTRLRAAAPRTEFAYRNCALDEIERIFLLEQTKAERYAGYVVPPLVVIATDRAKFIIQCRNDDIERRGLDEYYVDAQIDWAKWTVKAVKAGLFHLPRGQCGSLRNQVQARDP
ncbi:uncharacterized protein BDZ99DRAFT_462518 [Mytilinidion resinicola]|uniref:Uncharacterized protein n=1 Tax=Mytilinidion resinicola TaxID=574789 RepID=A0A6A6YQV9_9PEZI|nr:uncharacterized protein BDZ99DRAFT_462518 [Mytilinidion resinicola]KAF2811296.1 hypothetical protein BDZ99DRAFT_462518 [Mytilinidion resinicola]